MSKIKSLIIMDFMTIKPYSGTYTTLMLLVLPALLVTMSGNINTSIGVGMMFAMLFMSYPFVLADKNNLDSLYPTLSLDRATVVRGRYIFTFLLNIIAVAGAFALGALGLFISKQTPLNFSDEDVETVWLFLIMGAMFLVIEAIQLPFYFKLGYQKAKICALIPIVGLAGLFGAIGGYSGGNLPEGITALTGAVQENMIMLFSIVAAVLVILIVISYNLSVAFYKKREF